MNGKVNVYVKEILGQNLQLSRLPKNKAQSLPLYITSSYDLCIAELFGRELLIAEPKEIGSFSVLQAEKQIDVLRRAFHLIVLLLPQISAILRKRLIEKGINFIVPGKQLFLPGLLLDLREADLREVPRRKQNTLLPSAQFLVIYHIIHRYSKWQLENKPFKEIAEKTGYSAMAISKAIENLRYNEVVDVLGEKEKFIHFRLDRAELWNDLIHRKLLVSPILKKVFIDNYNRQYNLLMGGMSALPEYSDMNPARQKTYAIDRQTFYDLAGNDGWQNLNEQEGEVGLEVWKYDPKALSEGLDRESPVVDPLSLYLSLKESTDERTEMALEQILEKRIW